MSYSFRGASTLLDTDVVVAVVNSQYSVSVAPAKTAALAPGAYKWQSYVTGTGAFAGQRYTVEEGIVTVEAALSSLSGAQGQTHVERTLAKIEAEIEARMSGTGSSHNSYTIQGRSIAKLDFQQLLRFRSIYAEKVRRLNNRGQLSTPVLAQMNPADGSTGTSGEPTSLPWWYPRLNS